GLVWAVSGSPSMSTVPVVGLWSPRRHRMVVDLPAPLGPRNPVMEPSGPVKLNPSTTVTWPERFERRSTSIMRARPGTGWPNPDGRPVRQSDAGPAPATPRRRRPRRRGHRARDRRARRGRSGLRRPPGGGDRQRERQREPGEAGDDEDAGGGEGSGQHGVIRRPRPVPAPGAAEHSGSVDDAAGPRLLDQQLDGLAQSVGRDHAESSQRREPEPPAL